MLQKLRDRFTGKFAIAILALLSVPFAFFGISYYDFLGGGYAAKVEDVEISAAQLQDGYQAALARYAEMGSELPPELHILIKQSVLTNLIRETLVNLHLADRHYRVGNKSVTDFIQNVPEFQSDGKFSKDLYFTWLEGRGLTATQFEESQRHAMRLSQFQRGIAATAFVTPAEYRRYLNLYGEQRRAAIAVFGVDQAAEDIEVADANISAYYDAHPDEFLAPESVDIAYIEINRNDLTQNIEVSEEELQKYYVESRDRYLQDERRQARHILIPLGDDENAAQQQAAALAERARAGEPFEDLARQYSADTGTAEQGGDLGLAPKSQLPGALGDAIFSMKENEIAGPVRSDFGFHVVRLDAIEAGGPLPFEQVRAELERELRDAQVDDAFRALERQLSDALFDAQDLESMAGTVGREVQLASGFTREGGAPFGNNQAAIDAVFDPQVLNDGGVSDIVELDANRAAVFEVRDHQEAAQKPLAEVRDGIVAKLRAERAQEIARNRAQELETQLAAGAEFEAAAKAAGAEIKTSTLLRRQDDNTDPRVLEAIFRAPKPLADSPSIGNTVTQDGDYAVYSINAVVPGRPEAIPLEERDAGKLELAAESGRGDYSALILDLERKADIVRAEDALTEPAF
ncbi:MAG: peptidyl-prolyl cis-trans isomerase [Woeseiaceae bacterium]